MLSRASSCQSECSVSGRVAHGHGLMAPSVRAGRGNARLRNAGSRSARMVARAAGTLVKICGVTNPDDALLAVKAGADFIGMIMWPKAKRAVSDETAAQIACIAREHGAQAVGVFVDEDAATITGRCTRAGIPLAQLHGDGARASLAGLPPSLGVVYVLSCTPAGALHTPLPPPGARTPDWLLLDGMQGGSGQALDWSALHVPEGAASRGWLLAGGLGPHNVSEAARVARPSGVDVSSGVCGPDGLAKDPAKVSAFVQAAKAGSQ